MVNPSNLNPSDPGVPFIYGVVSAVFKMCFGLLCFAIILFILFLFIVFIKHACYQRPLRDYFTMLRIIISTIFKLFIKFCKGFFCGLFLANLVLIVAIIVFVFTHFFLVKAGFVADSFKLTHINIELNSENKVYSIAHLIFLILFFDFSLFSLILYGLSRIIIVISVYVHHFSVYFLTVYVYTCTPDFFFDITTRLCKYILYTSIKPFHMLSLFIVDSLNFFFYFVNDVFQNLYGLFFSPIQVPTLFPYFFKRLGFKPSDTYSQIDWSVFIADICVTPIFIYMIIFSEDKLVLKTKGKTYTCLVIILFLIILFFISFHLIGIGSFLFSCIAPDQLSNFSDFVDYFSKYAADKKSKYREGSSVIFYTMTLEELKQEMEVFYDLSESIILYSLLFFFTSIILMFFFIYLGFPYYCAKKFNSNHSLYKVSYLHTFPYGYPVCLDFLKKRASLNIFYVLFVIALFFLLLNVYCGFYAKHIFVFSMDKIISLYAQYCYAILHVLTFFALGPFVFYSSGLDIFLSFIVLIFVICPSFFFTMFLLFHFFLIPSTGLFSPFYDGNWRYNS